MTFVEKMLGAAAGAEVTVTPDIVVVNDGICAPAVEMAKGVKSPDKIRVFFDHDVPTGTSEAARVFGQLRRFAKSCNARFLQARGVGYCYLLAAEAKPGQIIIQGGSHAAIYGSIGALGLSCGAETLASVMENDAITLTVPQTVAVRVEGELKPGVSMMDAAMRFLADNPGLEGRAIEFSAPGLDAHDKAVLCSMACETGAVTAAVTETSGADITLDLSAVEPMVTMPCTSRDEQKNAVRQPLAAISGVSFNAGQIGGYTGGYIEDLRNAAALMEGKKLRLGFRLSIAPATSEDYLKALKEGIIEKFIDFGAQIIAVGDHSVNRQGAGVIGDHERLITTGLYTFTGCMGLENGAVYCASVESVLNAGFAQ